ncbi:aldo/keto reductase SSO2779 [Nanoarchaeota archaeon]
MLTSDYSKDKEGIEAIRRGIELGMTVIDTAEAYGNGHTEELVGEAIKDFNREDLFIITKVLPEHAKYEDVIKSAKNSMKRLGTYIDLYLLHWPSNYPLSETMKAFEKLVDDGVIGYFGLSNFDVNSIEEARNYLSKYDIVAVENKYSLIDRKNQDVLEYAKREGMLFLPYTPLEHGKFANDKFLEEIGKKYNKTPIQVALNWYICIDNVIPIPKAGNIKHVEENSGAMGWRLDKEDWDKINNHYI